MNPSLTQYLTITQYNKICKYWRIFQKYLDLIDQNTYNLSNKYDKYLGYEYISKCIQNHKRITIYNEQLSAQLNFYKLEYYKYLKKIGYDFNDILTQSKIYTQNKYLYYLFIYGILSEEKLNNILEEEQLTINFVNQQLNNGLIIYT